VSDIDELVGGTSVADKLAAQVARGQMSKYGGVNTPDDISGLHAGVTVGWLAQAFRMDPKTVKAKLAKCPTLKAHARGYIYEFRVAVAYLIPPKVDVEDFLRTAKIKDLPTRIQAEYWSAMRSKQIVEREAGNLWRTEEVLARFGEVFGMFKSTTQLWIEDMERSVVMTPEQRDFLTERVDTLLSSMHQKLTTMPTLSATPSSLDDFDDKPSTVEDDIAELI